MTLVTNPLNPTGPGITPEQRAAILLSGGSSPPPASSPAPVTWNVAPLASGSFSVAPAATINRVGESASERQLTVAGAGSIIPLVYGEDRIGARILNVVPYGSNVVVQALWCYECDSINDAYLNDKAFGGTATHYTGTQSTADATLVAAFAANGITYADTLAGLAYSVFVVPAADISGAPDFTARVRGRKVYDPRVPTTAWSDNPSLCLADFTTNTVYGRGGAIDYSTVTTCANANDTLISGAKARTVGIAFLEQAMVRDIEETLRTYAGCFIVRDGATTLLVPDGVRATDATYSHASGEIAAIGALEKKDVGDMPTVVEVAYTDVTQVPWREAIATAQLAGVGTTLPRRVSRISLPGIHSHAQAYREAIERLKKLALSDLSTSATVFDHGIRHTAGDVVELTHPVGLSSKKFRVTGADFAGVGKWALALVEYDPAAYSTDAPVVPSYPDTDLPSPSEPPALTAVDASEEIYQGDNGLWFSRARIVVTAPTFIWFATYRYEVWEGSTLIHAGTSVQPSYASPPLKDGPTYSCRVRMLSVTGAAGPESSDSFACVGKLAAPGNVPSITGFEAGGDVYLAWQPAVDVDIWRYELRFGNTSDAWEAMTLLDRVDALRYISKGVVPAGDRKFGVKALDSVGNYSATMASVNVTVTTDPESLQTEHWFASPTLTNMTAYQLVRGGTTFYVTDPNTASDKFGAQFTAALGTYTNELAEYHTSATSTWQSEAFDFGTSLSGDWNAEAGVSAIGGSYTLTLQLSDNGSSYTDYTSFPVKRAARYMKIKIEATTTSTLLVTAGTVRGWVNATTKKENGVKACAATGTNTVSLVGKYFTYKSIVATPVNTNSARFAVVDNIVMSTSGSNSFDLYLFDAAGTRVAGDVAWKFEGV